MALRSPTATAQPRGHVLSSGPAVEPVSEAELQTYLRSSSSILPDAEALRYIQQARNYIEEATGLAFITQSWTMALDQWPGYEMPLWEGMRQGSITEIEGGRPRWVIFPRYPLQSVTSVSTFDASSAETAITIASVFDVDTLSRPGRLSLRSGQTWPVALRSVNAIQLTYVSGFGDAALDVPPILGQAVLQMAAYLYTHRAECTMPDAYAASGARASVSSYAVRRI